MSVDSKPGLVAALANPRAYPHAVDSVRLIETHMSWVFLTGPYAYKVKKPVNFGFADFSTLALRQYFCEEELRCNRQFAAPLYRAVVPIVGDVETGFRIGHAEERAAACEWAVQMVQFDPALQADELLASRQLAVADLRAFGNTLARQHQALAPMFADLYSYAPVAPVLDNFATLQATVPNGPVRQRIDALAEGTEAESQRLRDELLARQAMGRIRECHGDLHLSNMVQLRGGLCAFDCLEFDRALRSIDVYCDVAFLFMDCLVRDRADLAYGFLDGYLDTAGDFDGLGLLPYFARYRSMVRAKVAALRLAQAPEDATAAAKLERHLAWTEAQRKRSTGELLIMNGVSGTGKSYWAQQLVSALGAVRLRSDVLRKAEFSAPAGSAAEGLDAKIQGGLYRADVSEQVYARLATLSERLLCAGECVIVDAACLERAARQTLLEAARRAQAQARVIRLTAPTEVLTERIVERGRQGADASDADVDVLRWQQQHEDVPVAAMEPLVTVATEALTLPKLLEQLS